jgi:hypothetical protein
VAWFAGHPYEQGFDLRLWRERLSATIGPMVIHMRTNLIAWHLWQMTGPGARLGVPMAHRALELAVQRSAPELETRWQALRGNERRVAVTIANEIAPQGTRVQREVGLAGHGAAQRAVRVKASEIAEVRDDVGTLTDPLFAEWLQ